MSAVTNNIEFKKINRVPPKISLKMNIKREEAEHITEMKPINHNESTLIKKDHCISKQS